MIEFSEQIKLSVAKGLIDNSIGADADLVPRILQNDKQKQEKVLATICKHLETCIDFKFAVAFLTRSGVASIHNSIKAFQKTTLTLKVQLLSLII